MINTLKIYNELSETMGEQSARKLAEVIGAMYEELLNTVTKKDFNELKDIVKELADIQKRTEVKVEELAEAQKRTEVKIEELAEAQKRTEVKVEELAEAQKRTEVKVGELAEAQRETQKEVGRLDRVMQELADAQKRTEIKVAELSEDIRILTKGLDETRGEVGGLSRSMSYAFENEAYRSLPAVLKEKYGIEIKERIIRAEIGGSEINIFCKAEREGKEVLVIGEAKLRLDERRERKKGESDVFEELDEKARAVKNEYGKIEIVRLLITHYATKGFIKKAKENGVIVVQSFEW